MNLLELNWGLLAPELTIVIVGVIITLADLFMKDDRDRKIFGWISLLGILGAIYFTIGQININEVEYLLDNTYRVDSFAGLFKLIFLIGTAMVILMSMYHIDKKEIKYEGEMYYLLLTALLGAMIMASSADLITLYIGLELLSISSYILVGIKKNNLKSNEAAYKYVITGGASSAVFLFGASYIYGLTGSTNLFVIGERLPEAFYNGYEFFVYLGFFMMLVGLAYKISAVPSYMWAPDVYEGAPTPITAFLSVVSKAAGFAMILRIFMTSFTTTITDPATYQYLFFNELTIFLGVLAGLTMIIGNTLALRQTNIKRLLAMSSVAQAGYILVPLATMSMASVELVTLGINNMLFYLFVYLMMNLGVFTIVTVVTKDADTDDIKSFQGLYHRSPFLAVAMSVFLISLAGLPITAGFIGKFNIFISALADNHYYLAGTMIVTSVISYFYYFNIIRQMYMRPGHTEARLKVPFSLQVVILLAFLGVVLFGLMPNLLYDFIAQNFSLIEMFQIGFTK